HRPESFEVVIGAQWQFECGGRQMPGQHVGIVGIDDRVFRRLGEEIVWMTQQVLIDRIVAGKQNSKALILSSAAAASLLPTTGNRPGVVDEQGDVERTNIDAKLEGISGGDAPKFAAE